MVVLSRRSLSFCGVFFDVEKAKKRQFLRKNLDLFVEKLVSEIVFEPKLNDTKRKEFNVIAKTL